MTKSEINRLREIKTKDYMIPTIERIDEFVNSHEDKEQAWLDSFNHLREIMLAAYDTVKEQLEERKTNGEIADISQAMKSIAGNGFSNALIYTFLKNKEIGNISESTFITSRPSDIPNFNNIATIDVDGETQKPDVDIIIYSLGEDGVVNNCVILSLKTSLRERAGQTFKWKLLMEISQSTNDIKTKYNINYNPPFMPKVCFATIDFYNEINNPQHRGMFKFFDKSFVAHETASDLIFPLSTLVEFIEQTFEN